MRFHLDEQMDHAIATGLRRRGIDVTTARARDADQITPHVSRLHVPGHTRNTQYDLRNIPPHLVFDPIGVTTFFLPLEIVTGTTGSSGHIAANSS